MSFIISKNKKEYSLYDIMHLGFPKCDQTVAETKGDIGI